MSAFITVRHFKVKAMFFLSFVFLKHSVLQSFSFRFLLHQNHLGCLLKIQITGTHLSFAELNFRMQDPGTHILNQ